MVGLNNNCSYELKNYVPKNIFVNINGIAVLILSLFFGLIFIIIILMIAGKLN